MAKYKRKTEIVSSTILKLYSAGLSDEETKLIIESIYDANVSKSYISSVTDAVMEDVRRFGEMPVPPKVFCLYLDSTYVQLRQGAVQKEAINIAMVADADGQKAILGYSITPAESSEACEELLQSFKSRSLQEVRHLKYTNNPIESFNKQIKRELRKQIWFVTEEALEKRIVTMFLHFNKGWTPEK